MVFLPAWSFTSCWKLEATVCGKDRIKVLPASSARKKTTTNPLSNGYFLSRSQHLHLHRLTHRLFITWTHGRQSLNRGCLNLPVSPPRPPTRWRWPLSGRVVPPVFCFFASVPRPCLLLRRPERLPSFLRRASNTNWQRPSPLSSLLSSLPFPSPNTVFFFSLPAGKKVKKKKKN